jgi:hypothetical protein
MSTIRRIRPALGPTEEFPVVDPADGLLDVLDLTDAALPDADRVVFLDDDDYR